MSIIPDYMVVPMLVTEFKLRLLRGSSKLYVENRDCSIDGFLGGMC